MTTRHGDTAPHSTRHGTRRIDLAPSAATSAAVLVALSVTLNNASGRVFGAPFHPLPERLGAMTHGSGGRAREGATPSPGGVGRLAQAAACAPFRGRSLPRPLVHLVIYACAVSHMLIDMFFDMLFDMVIDMLNGMLIVIPVSRLTTFSTPFVSCVHLGVQPCR